MESYLQGILQINLLYKEEKEYTGEVCFKNCDLDLCSILIFNKTLGKGCFMGNAVSL